MTETTEPEQFGEMIELLRKIDERLDRMEAELAELRKRTRKRSTFASREERDAYFAASRERLGRLQALVARLEAERAAKRRTA